MSSQGNFWDFTNLYEVRKTINFEFKPSLDTKNRILNSSNQKSTKTVEIENLFDNQSQESVKEVREYFKSLENDFSMVIKNFETITKNIFPKWCYENFRIYVDTAKIKLLGKDFRDCYQSMEKKKSWRYKGINNKLKPIKFGDFLTVHHLFGFHYDKETRTGEFEKLLQEKINLLVKKYNFLNIELKDFLDTNNQSEKFITKPEILDRLKSFAHLIQEICLLMDILCDEGKNGSEGNKKFLDDLQAFKKVIEKRKFLEIAKEIIEQINKITNPKAYHYKFTLNFKAKNPNTQLSTDSIFLTESELQERLKTEMDNLEKWKKEKSDCQSYISKFDNLAGKDCTEEKWQKIQNKQGLPQNFSEAQKQYEEKKKRKEDLVKKISSCENEKNSYSVINQLKAALRNSKNTHFGVVIERNGLFYLALENKFANGKLKPDNKYVLPKLGNNDSSCKILQYESLTWKAVEKLCLLPTSSLAGKDDKIIQDWSKFCKAEIIIEKKNDKDKRKIFNLAEIKTYLKKIISENNLSRFFNEKEFEKCKNLDEIKSYFDDVCFSYKWESRNWGEIKKLDGEGEIDLYQIFNKDFELDEYFATSENDKEKMKRLKEAKEKLGDKFIPKQNNPERGKNLFTLYWENCFQELCTEKYRLQPEGKIYLREINPIQKSLRYQEPKVLGDFGILFNPIAKEIDQSSKKGEERISNFNEYLKKHISENEICVIGIDRGENSLVSYGLFKFKKKIIQDNDVKVRFSEEVRTDGWILDEIVEASDLSAVKVFNQEGNWRESIFVEQKDDFYFVEKNEEQYDDEKNRENAEKKKKELQKIYPNYVNRTGEESERVFVLPIRNKELQRSWAYAVKILSWQEKDGSVYNYRVAQEILKEKRLEQKENNKDYELFDAEKFKNGYVSSLTGFIAEKVQEYNALVSFENLNIAGGKDGNLRKTFGTTVYQIIENKLISKLGYCVVKKSPNNHFQVAPKIRRIEELKKDIVSGDEKNKDYQLGFVQITDESNTSKICPNCGYSKNRYHNSSCENNILDLVLKTDKLQNIDFGIDESKKKEFPINSETVAYKYSQDGIMTESLKQDNKDFCKTICDTRQNQTKSKDFIRCVYCGFDSRLPEKNNQKLEKIDGGDILATYNIAKRWLKYIEDSYIPTQKPQ